MTARHKLITSAAASLAAVTLVACETDTYGASAGPSERLPAKDYTTGSSTGTPTGSDVNVMGAATAGSAPQPPARSGFDQ